MTYAPIDALATMPPKDIERHLRALSSDDIDHMLRDWRFHARPEQLAPDWAWRWWAVVTGRGYGKTRIGAEYVADRCEQFADHRARHLVGLINQSFNLVSGIQIAGESGLGAVCERRGHRLHHASTSLEAELRVWRHGVGWWPSFVELHTAVDPERIRGRNFHTIHADEAAAWRNVQDAEGGTTFTNADMGLRALCPPGMQPQGLVTTTPKAVQLVRDLVAGIYGATALTRGTMFDNAANLDVSYIENMLRRYLGTRLGAQELLGELLDDITGALWRWRAIDADRFRGSEAALPEFDHIVVGVDPTGGRAEAGIVVAGSLAAHVGVCPCCGKPNDPMFRHAFVLEDGSGEMSADEWPREVVRLYRLWGAHVIAAERNYGGDMVAQVIRNIDPMVKVELVTASRGKRVRAEPISGLYDQHRVHHWHEFVDLENQMTTWVPGDDHKRSPDRMDALVWALTYLADEITSQPMQVGLPIRETPATARRTPAGAARGARPPRRSALRGGWVPAGLPLAA